MAAAVKRLDALFRELSTEVVEVTREADGTCGVHPGRRGSVVIERRGSLSLENHPPAACLRRRDSMVLGPGAVRDQHPSAFPSTLRRDSLSPVPPSCLSKRRFSTDSLEGGIRRNSWDRRGSVGSGAEEPSWERPDQKRNIKVFLTECNNN